MSEVDRVAEVRIAGQATLYRTNNPTFARWAAGYGPIRHTPETQVRVAAMADLLRARGVRGDGLPLFDLLYAADRVASAGMWLVVPEGGYLGFAELQYVRGSGPPGPAGDGGPDPWPRPTGSRARPCGSWST